MLCGFFGCINSAMNPLAVLAGADVGTVGALGSLNTVGRTIARAAQIHPKSCFFFFFAKRVFRDWMVQQNSIWGDFAVRKRSALVIKACGMAPSLSTTATLRCSSCCSEGLTSDFLTFCANIYTYVPN